MSRKLVWIELKRFRGFGCSDVDGGSNPPVLLKANLSMK